MSLVINGADARQSFGLHLASPGGWLDAPPVRRSTARVPGTAGEVQTAPADEGPRRLTLRGTIIGSSAADARAKRTALLVALSRRAGATLILPDRPTVQLTAVLDSFTTAADGPVLVERHLAVECTLTALDPYWYDTAETVLPVTALGVPVPLGDAPVRPTLVIQGNALDPVFELLAADGVTVVQTLDLTGYLQGAGDELVIDCRAMTMTLNGSLNVIDALADGDFLTLDVAEQGDYGAEAWPVLRCSSGDVVQVKYRRAWR